MWPICVEKSSPHLLFLLQKYTHNTMNRSLTINYFSVCRCSFSNLLLQLLECRISLSLFSIFINTNSCHGKIMQHSSQTTSHSNKCLKKTVIETLYWVQFNLHENVFDIGVQGSVQAGAAASPVRWKIINLS